MNHLKKTVSALLLLVAMVACGSVIRETAMQTAVASKGVVDSGGKAWVGYVDGKKEECKKQFGEGTLPTPEARAQCLGPAAKASQVLTAFEAVHAAQLVLYLALIGDKTDDEIRRALVDLIAKINVVRMYLQEAGILKGT